MHSSISQLLMLSLMGTTSYIETTLISALLLALKRYVIIHLMVKTISLHKSMVEINF